MASPSYQDLVDRIGALEARQLTVRDLPLKALQDSLEQNWQPNAGVLLGSASIDDTVLVATPDWQAVSFGTGWGNNTAAGAQPAQFYKRFDRVYMRGYVARASGTGIVVCTLPPGYRPPLTVRIPLASLGAYGQARVDSDGTVNFVVGNPADADLAPINFRVT